MWRIASCFFIGSRINLLKRCNVLFYILLTDKIRIGLRVVRGVDWDRGKEDGGEGNVGTVVEILNNSQQVRVQWDSQDTLNVQENPYSCVYRTGMDKKYDLRIFDNAQTGEESLIIIVLKLKISLMMRG
jgi:hypothetical protein